MSYFFLAISKNKIKNEYLCLSSTVETIIRLHQVYNQNVEKLDQNFENQQKNVFQFP